MIGGWTEKVTGSMSAWTEKATVSKQDMIEKRSGHGNTATKPWLTDWSARVTESTPSWTVVGIESTGGWIAKVIGLTPEWTAGAIAATGGWTIGVTA